MICEQPYKIGEQQYKFVNITSLQTTEIWSERLSKPVPNLSIKDEDL